MLRLWRLWRAATSPGAAPARRRQKRADRGLEQRPNRRANQSIENPQARDVRSRKHRTLASPDVADLPARRPQSLRKTPMECKSTSGLGDSGEACQTVGDDIGAGVEGGACEPSDRKAAEGFDGPKDDLIRLAIVGCRDRSDERRLACCAAPAAAGPGAADIGVVHLDVAFQAFARVTLQHDLSELVLHHPSSRLGDAKSSTEFDTGNALL